MNQLAYSCSESSPGTLSSVQSEVTSPFLALDFVCIASLSSGLAQLKFINSSDLFEELMFGFVDFFPPNVYLFCFVDVYLCLENPMDGGALVGCSPWGRQESDTTERLHFHFSLSCIGEGNGNPLQCSCLGNPRDRGTWWAAVYGVTQSWPLLKRLSSSRACTRLLKNTTIWF